MKFILAPDSFKEGMAAERAAEVMRDAITSVIGEKAACVELPVGDGGEGTLEVITAAMGGRYVQVAATGPLGESVAARYGISGDGATAIVEMAQASGLALVAPEARDPLAATTYGTGELIRHALGQPGLTSIVVTIGGSATNDCGAGMLQALGAELLGEDGLPIGRGGGQLANVTTINLATLDARLHGVRVRVACDVTNPLVGSLGASRVFGPQKGATPEIAELLDAALTLFANRLETATGQRLHDVAGAGAAGGIGAALMLCGGKLERGIDLVLDALRFEEHLVAADYVFTGEGRIDAQTPNGKVVAGISRRAKAAGVPVVAFAGNLEAGYEPLYEQGLLAAFSITPRPTTLADALSQGETNLFQTVSNAVRLLQGKN